jgi:ADP-ribose pyrophosphatase YjhB (NUDIX family)
VPHPDLAPLRFCPACAAEALVFEHDKVLRCTACGQRWFHNVAVAVCLVLRVDDAVLYTCRARAPRAGFLDFPGGFVDPEETLEEALVRETREELDLDLAGTPLHYLFSQHNRYPFEGITYRTADAYFGVRLPERPALRCADDVREALWLDPARLAPERLAFDAVRRATARLREDPHP